jgi:hypothetical protein
MRGIGSPRRVLALDGWEWTERSLNIATSPSHSSTSGPRSTSALNVGLGPVVTARYLVVPVAFLVFV